MKMEAEIGVMQQKSKSIHEGQHPPEGRREVGTDPSLAPSEDLALPTPGLRLTASRTARQ